MMKHPRSIAVAGAALAMAAALAACGSDGGGGATGSAASSTKKQDLTIAFLMPCSTCADRFEMQDKPLFEAAVNRLAPGAKVIANNGEGDGSRQIAQTESALTNGADVIVVSPLDEATGAAIAAKATQAHVPVVSYDGLLTDGKIDAFVSFDNTKVGELQGEYLADHLDPGGVVAFINGDQSIAPGRQFRAGAHQALDPLFKSGKLKLGYEADAQQFDPQQARTLTEQALTRRNDDVNGVIAANDGIAGGVAEALKPRKLTGRVLITGQDASDAGLQRILLGEQSMTVYKAIKSEADSAAAIAIALGEGDAEKAKSLTKTTVDNGAGKVPSVLLTPVVLTKDNIADTVFKDGFTTKAKVCRGAAAARCPS